MKCGQECILFQIAKNCPAMVCIIFDELSTREVYDFACGQLEKRKYEIKVLRLWPCEFSSTKFRLVHDAVVKMDATVRKLEMTYNERGPGDVGMICNMLLKVTGRMILIYRGGEEFSDDEVNEIKEYALNLSDGQLVVEFKDSRNFG